MTAPARGDVESGSTGTTGASDAAAARPARTFTEILRDIRFEQTLFSLPFALLATFLASGGWPNGWTLLLILVALVAARSAAMAVNRAADALIDARNPRTSGRAVPAGRVSRGTMAFFALVMTGVFVAAAASLNQLCLVLSPVALLFLIGYSWTKRITPLCHVLLGMTLGIAPLGAWVAVRGNFDGPFHGWDLTPWLLGLAVCCWVAGFDVIYACPDAEKDQEEGLYSIPKVLGVRRAFRVSELLHVVALGLFVATGLASADLGRLWWIGIVLGAGVLVAEHVLVRPGRYELMGTAFFKLNAVFGLTLLALGASEVVLLNM